MNLYFSCLINVFLFLGIKVLVPFNIVMEIMVLMQDINEKQFTFILFIPFLFF